MLGDYRTVLLPTWVWGHPKGAGAATAVSHQPRLFSVDEAGPTLDQPYPRGFRPFATLGDIEGDAFTFIEGHEPGWCESRDVDEYVLSSTIPGDEAEALVDIDPFHGALGAPVALTRFAQDSLQEGTGFEPPVPRLG